MEIIKRYCSKMIKGITFTYIRIIIHGLWKKKEKKKLKIKFNFKQYKHPYIQGKPHVNNSECKNCLSKGSKGIGMWARPTKAITFEKIIGRGLRLLVLGIFLYAAYEQFFDNKSASEFESESKIIDADTLRADEGRILDFYDSIPIKDELIKTIKF